MRSSSISALIIHVRFQTPEKLKKEKKLLFGKWLRELRERDESGVSAA